VAQTRFLSDSLGGRSRPDAEYRHRDRRPFCVLAFFLFWNGAYWLGILAAFIFMVLDTVDGKLARCTGTSSKWGEVFDHGIDLVHPPFWWWAWAHGLPSYGTPLEPVYATMLLAAIVIGYVAQRVIEGIFIARFGMHIHVWRPIDSRFRLITARRNPNMVILVGALLFGRPDSGWSWSPCGPSCR
jgi:phosphatidylglycerophosphate synthase